ncbi:tRNA epoxyqueuosine(34) reductase QueG [Leeia aquatica]|uniref:Epoxyqueuosine reductase n=1 Tax=Leeia aquatica TaxID=2725557 RepID=A0A847SC03_9NEIS|nr:tRNA epoxyqueuosine(34) reductase QueG [Leeia aquatica]NLR75036.1 tRNA epoxyqueuosine(34) reductase QueG [Leeia aquatica]
MQHTSPSASAALSDEQGLMLAQLIRQWGQELGLAQIGITDTDLSDAEPELLAWLDRGYHGEMDYMAKHGTKRSRPTELVPGTLRILSARMNYLAEAPAQTRARMHTPGLAMISRYALGRDYHKVVKQRLEQLARRMQDWLAQHGLDHQYRVFTDSAPVLEVQLARKAGVGWRGKHTLLLNREAGSYFFLGEIFTTLPLPVDAPVRNHCGQCQACMDVCPTQAIVAPYQVDARRCISYLTIELHGAIPEPLRPLIGNRVYGCDDCQLFCPWNRFAQLSSEPDFKIRHGLDQASLCELFSWDETTFLQRMAGSAIYRIGHERWLRNLAVGLGNAVSSSEVIAALQQRLGHPSSLVREHVVWALKQHGAL